MRISRAPTGHPALWQAFGALRCGSSGDVTAEVCGLRVEALPGRSGRAWFSYPQIAVAHSGWSMNGLRLPCQLS
ncbi:hypothetical protein IW245_001647 [Longispora fulva]|uniref:Uncharacterized protein n=1 Tax=Longispora fulva TaxID=619741 RepID=A0A8J7G840_9ACTN|nr:hypothetical protein [Longispora fulva]